MSNPDLQSLEKLVRSSGHCFSYDPLADEPDPRPLFAMWNVTPLLFPRSPSVDPFAYAASQSYSLLPTRYFPPPCLFIPGTSFDAAGTRHGRGGGWFDRFLSAVPKDWVRIGVVDGKKFFSSKLERQAWDEPMDWLLIGKRDQWRAARIDPAR